jgi:class 3 adenylate cyclase
MTKLPQGTVTFLFTDIQGSTRLLASLGESYGDALEQHRRLLREAFTSCGGIEVDTQGDAFFYAFARAKDAVTAAVAGQRALSSHDFGDCIELKVRMGIHTGEPARSDEGYVGPDVHLGSRICAVAWGGQIVVSAATAAVISGLKDITLRLRGTKTRCILRRTVSRMRRCCSLSSIWFSASSSDWLRRVRRETVRPRSWSFVTN